MARNRIIDKSLLELMANKPCFICGKKGEIHHIIPKNALGPDLPFNLINLCPLHHRGEWHDKGVKFFLNKHPQMLEELSKRGFEVLESFGKVILIPPKFKGSL